MVDRVMELLENSDGRGSSSISFLFLRSCFQARLPSANVPSLMLGGSHGYANGIWNSTLGASHASPGFEVAFKLLLERASISGTPVHEHALTMLLDSLSVDHVPSIRMQRRLCLEVLNTAEKVLQSLKNGASHVP